MPYRTVNLGSPGSIGSIGQVVAIILTNRSTYFMIMCVFLKFQDGGSTLKGRQTSLTLGNYS